MDIFSHAFWNVVAAKSANSKIKYFKKRKPINAIWSAVWGIAPDIFAFAPIFILSAIVIFFGPDGTTIFDIPHPSEVEPMTGNGFFIFKLTKIFYNIGHSVVIFAVVFAAMYFVFKRIRWEMMGWLLHIIIDIPTHSYKFYPTPVFWPLVKWKFDGVAWGTPWFLALNISAIGLVFLFYFLHTHRKNKL